MAFVCKRKTHIYSYIGIDCMMSVIEGMRVAMDVNINNYAVFNLLNRGHARGVCIWKTFIMAMLTLLKFYYKKVTFESTKICCTCYEFIQIVTAQAI